MTTYKIIRFYQDFDRDYRGRRPRADPRPGPGSLPT